MVVNPEVVESVLGAELSAELDDSTADYLRLLHSIQHEKPFIARLFMPRLQLWLENGVSRTQLAQDNQHYAAKLAEVARILLQHGDEAACDSVRVVAMHELEGVKSLLCAQRWLPILMQLSPCDGIKKMEEFLVPIQPTQYGQAVDLFATCFGDRISKAALDLSAPEFTPELLYKLLLLAEKYVRSADDLKRRECMYTPTSRDHAESARGNIFSAFLACSGPAGWAIKIKLAHDPAFSRYKDYTLAMAHEKAATECDSNTFTEDDVKSLLQQNELPPLTRDAMFALLTDRLEDLQEVLLKDDSPRGLWALITDEKEMRRTLAREFRSAARGAYTVDQEAVTADEKETDIRFRSTRGEQEAIIELKIGDKGRSATELKNTLMEQVVTKYMAADNCKSGCLLITLAKSHTWNHPDTREKLDFKQLVDFLNAEARNIEKEMGGVLRLVVCGLDLRPRLQTEKQQQTKSKGKKGAAKL